jgi:hypothetical protein
LQRPKGAFARTSECRQGFGHGQQGIRQLAETPVVRVEVRDLDLLETRTLFSLGQAKHLLGLDRRGKQGVTLERSVRGEGNRS